MRARALHDHDGVRPGAVAASLGSRMRRAADSPAGAPVLVGSASADAFLQTGRGASADADPKCTGAGTDRLSPARECVRRADPISAGCLRTVDGTAWMND